MLTDRQFERLCSAARDRIGIDLGTRHRKAMERRLRRRLDAGGIESVDALLDGVDHGDDWAARDLTEIVTTSFTRFFRVPWHFEVAAEHLLWRADVSGRGRVWCAAASTGQEAYSIALAAIEIFHRDDPPVEIVATDINQAALAQAATGEFDQILPDALLQRFDGQLSQAGGRAVVGGAARRLISFRRINFADADWPLLGDFDVVFCRNVLMYLYLPLRTRVLERIIRSIVPGGLLFLDPAETPGDAGHLLLNHGHGLYTVADHTLGGAGR